MRYKDEINISVELNFVKLITKEKNASAENKSIGILRLYFLDFLTKNIQTKRIKNKIRSNIPEFTEENIFILANSPKEKVIKNIGISIFSSATSDPPKNRHLHQSFHLNK